MIDVMRRRSIRIFFLVLFLLLTVFSTVGVFLPINLGAKFFDGGSATHAPRFFARSQDHEFEVGFLSTPLTPRTLFRGTPDTIVFHDAGEDVAIQRFAAFHGFSYQCWDFIDNFSSLVMRRRRALMVPYWMLAIVSTCCFAGLTLPILRLYRGRVADRDAVPCLRCGYDLRASRNVCPECGEPVLVHRP
jgi:hypothetical protein